MIGEKVGKYSDFAPLVMRLVLGLVLVWHGLLMSPGAKLLDIAGTADGFGMYFGLPVPIVFAVIAAVVEGIGGILLLLGVATRLVGLLVVIQFAIASLLHLVRQGIAVSNYELPLLILAGGVVVLLLGGGPYSLEKTIFKKELL